MLLTYRIALLKYHRLEANYVKDIQGNIVNSDLL